MKRLLMFAAMLLVTVSTASVSAQSNAAPSLHVALKPCQVFSGSLATNSAVNFSLTGICNIPNTATSVEVNVVLTGAANGTLKLWEYDSAEPSAPIVEYGSGTTNSYTDTRLCAPAFECQYSSTAKSSTALSNLTLVAVGYFAPLE